MNDIVITGMSVWDTLGHNIDHNFQTMLNLHENQPVQPTIKNFLGFGLSSDPLNIAEFQEKYFSKLKNPRFTQIGMWVADQAIAQSGLGTNLSRVGTVGTTLYNDAESQIHTAGRFIQGSTRAVPNDLFFTTNEALSASLARIYDIRGMSWTMTASCSAGIYAIELSSAMIQQNLLDQVIIVAAEFGTESYNAFRTYGTNPYSRTNSCRPFDINRDGIVMGDGIAAIVIESNKSAESRGAKPLAKILGTGTATQHAHRTNPRLTQDCYYDAFNKALTNAHLTSKDIGWISGHATGTIDGDDIENAIMDDCLPGIPITSFKGHLGHTMGASGLVELVYTIKSQQTGMIPAIANTEKITLPSSLKFVLENTKTDGRPVIKNSYGFGGRAASIILQAY